MAKSESVDEEILQYFQHLSDLQKQAVLAIVRAFAVKHQVTTEFRKKLIEEERRRHFEGHGQSNSWADVKSMALNKNERAT